MQLHWEGVQPCAYSSGPLNGDINGVKQGPGPLLLLEKMASQVEIKQNNILEMFCCNRSSQMTVCKSVKICGQPTLQFLLALIC